MDDDNDIPGKDKEPCKTSKDTGRSSAANDATWGEGSASALRNLRNLEERRSRSRPQRSADDHPSRE
jgi:hypothetical protein